MGIGISVFLIAVGAVLAFAVNVQASGIDLSTVGVILMIVGAIGLVASLVIFGGWRRPMVDDGYVDDAPVTRRRTVRRGF